VRDDLSLAACSLDQALSYDLPLREAAGLAGVLERLPQLAARCSGERSAPTRHSIAEMAGCGVPLNAPEMDAVARVR